MSDIVGSRVVVIGVLEPISPAVCRELESFVRECETSVGNGDLATSVILLLVTGGSFDSGVETISAPPGPEQTKHTMHFST